MPLAGRIISNSFGTYPCPAPPADSSEKPSDIGEAALARAPAAMPSADLPEAALAAAAACTSDDGASRHTKHQRVTAINGYQVSVDSLDAPGLRPSCATEVDTAAPGQVLVLPDDPHMSTAAQGGVDDAGLPCQPDCGMRPSPDESPSFQIAGQTFIPSSKSVASDQALQPMNAVCEAGSQPLVPSPPPSISTIANDDPGRLATGGEGQGKLADPELRPSSKLKVPRAGGQTEPAGEQLPGFQQPLTAADNQQACPATGSSIDEDSIEGTPEGIPESHAASKLRSMQLQQDCPGTGPSFNGESTQGMPACHDSRLASAADQFPRQARSEACVGRVLFLQASFFNHACQPNCYVHRSPTGAAVIAINSIEVGMACPFTPLSQSANLSGL